MITLLLGENSFEVERELKRLINEFDGEVEKVDPVSLTAPTLNELLTCVSLFSTSRLIIIRSLSDNSSCWNQLSDIIPNISEGTDVILIEPKPDKRTNTFKKIKELATVKEFASWSERDIVKAENWVASEAKTLDLVMDKKKCSSVS